MEVRSYIYVTNEGRTLCFGCAVLEVAALASLQQPHCADKYDLKLEQGSTGNGCDMRSAPTCAVCGKRLKDFCIA